MDIVNIELIDISNSKIETDDWGTQTSNPTKRYTSIIAQEINLTLNETYNIMSLNKYKEQKQLLIYKFEYSNQEKVRYDNKEWNILNVKTSPKNNRKLLIVIVRE